MGIGHMVIGMGHMVIGMGHMVIGMGHAAWVHGWGMVCAWG